MAMLREFGYMGNKVGHVYVEDGTPEDVYLPVALRLLMPGLAER